MIAVPTASVDVLRGTITDVYGDTVDADTVAIPAVPASIIERQQKVKGPKNSEDRIVRIFKARVPRGTGVLKGDRLRDRATGAVYIIDNVYEQANPFWAQDQTLDLSLTS